MWHWDVTWAIIWGDHTSPCALRNTKSWMGSRGKQWAHRALALPCRGKQLWWHFPRWSVGFLQKGWMLFQLKTVEKSCSKVSITGRWMVLSWQPVLPERGWGCHQQGCTSTHPFTPTLGEQRHYHQNLHVFLFLHRIWEVETTFKMLDFEAAPRGMWGGTASRTTALGSVDPMP